MSTNQVTFKVAGNDVLSFIDKAKQKADELSTSMLQNAEREAITAKAQLKHYEDQIKALERRNRLETVGSRSFAAESRDNLKAKAQSDFENEAGRLEDLFVSGKISRKRKERGIERAEETLQDKNKLADAQYRDQLESIREQERQQALQTRLLRENIEAVRHTSAQELAQMQRGDREVLDQLDENADPDRRLARQLALDNFEEETQGSKKKDILSQIAGALALNEALNLTAQMPSAKNELDFIKPTMSMIGMAMGGVMGNLLDSVAGAQVLGIGGGSTNWGALGTQLGQKAGEFIGSALERSYRSRDELTVRNFRLQALSGRDFGVDAMGGDDGLGGTGLSSIMSDLKDYGLSFRETSELQYKIATSQASGNSLNRQSEEIMALEQALGVNRETSLALMGMRYDTNVMKTISGAWKAGQGGLFAGDRTFLNEFIAKNYSTLRNQFATSNQDIGSATIFDVISRFDKLGGAFSARDGRSIGLTGQINQALMNPQSDALKAYSFLALRQSNPNAGIADLLAEREKGFAGGNGSYLKSMLEYVNMLGGDDQMKRMNIAGMFGVNQGAAKLIYENMDQLMKGNMAMGDLTSADPQSIYQLGKSQTSKYTKSTAEIENEFIKDVSSAVKLVGTKMTGLFGDMVDELQEFIKEKLQGADGVKQNPIPRRK